MAFCLQGINDKKWPVRALNVSILVVVMALALELYQLNDLELDVALMIILPSSVVGLSSKVVSLEYFLYGYLSGFMGLSALLVDLKNSFNFSVPSPMFFIPPLLLAFVFIVYPKLSKKTMIFMSGFYLNWIVFSSIQGGFLIRLLLIFCNFILLVLSHYVFLFIEKFTVCLKTYYESKNQKEFNLI